MDMLRKLSPPAQALLGGLVLYVIFSFFDWQQVCVDSFVSACAGVSEWHGFGGVITALCALLLLAWEAVRLLNVKIDLGGISHGLVSLGLALLLLLLTIITFLTHNEARHWPAYIGLVLSIVIAAAAVMRGKEEGVDVGDLGALAGSVTSSMGGSSSAGTAPASAPSPPPAPAAPSEPPESQPPPAGDEPAS
jgi:hypothetical protein